MEIVRRQPTPEEYPFKFNQEGSGYLWFQGEPDKVYSWGRYKAEKQQTGYWPWKIKDNLTGKESFCDQHMFDKFKEYGLL